VGGQSTQFIEAGGEIAAPEQVEQILEAVDDEIARLEIVDVIAGAHYAFEIEGEVMGGRVVHHIFRLAEGRDDACAVDTDALRLADQPEFDGVPVEAGKELHPLGLDCHQPDATILVHVVGIGGIGQQRHMAEDIMEYVGLLQIVELLAAADEGPGRELAVGQHLEEGTRRDEAWHRHHFPAGQPPQALIHARKVRYAFRADAERCKPVEIFLADMPFQGLLLAFEQDAPDRVVLAGVALPALVDDAVVDGLGGQNGMSGHRFHS
jgi:hypothetical protein